MYKVFRAHFEHFEDTRRSKSIQHAFFDILFISVVTILSGGDSFEDMHNFSVSQEEWLKKFIKLENGAPSADTFSRVLNSISPDSFSRHFARLFSDISKFSGIKVVEPHIAIDGKTLRGSISEDETGKKTITHIVNALSSEYGLSLAQVKVKKEQYTNEVQAILDILDILEPKKSMITLDGISNSKIALKIIDKKANYTMVVKKNNSKLFNMIKDRFRRFKGSDYVETFREEDKYKNLIREVHVLDISSNLPNNDYWVGANKIIVYRHLSKDTKSLLNEKFYVSSKNMNSKEAYKYVRGHWSIENSLHWTLDVIFNEDKNRTKKGNAPAILSGLRQIARNIVKMNTDKLPLSRKLKKAAWEPDYREKLITQHITNWKLENKEEN